MLRHNKRENKDRVKSKETLCVHRTTKSNKQAELNIIILFLKKAKVLDEQDIVMNWQSEKNTDLITLEEGAKVQKGSGQKSNILKKAER